MGNSHWAVIDALSSSTDWDCWPLAVVEMFTKACGMDFCSLKDMRRQEGYIRKRGIKNLSYLRESPDWERVYKPLYERLCNYMDQHAQKEKRHP